MDYITRRVTGFLRAQPDANILSVSQNDNSHYCRTPEEMAIIDAEVGRSPSRRHHISLFSHTANQLLSLSIHLFAVALHGRPWSYGSVARVVLP